MNYEALMEAKKDKDIRAKVILENEKYLTEAEYELYIKYSRARKRRPVFAWLFWLFGWPFYFHSIYLRDGWIKEVKIVIGVLTFITRIFIIALPIALIDAFRMRKVIRQQNELVKIKVLIIMHNERKRQNKQEEEQIEEVFVEKNIDEINNEFSKEESNNNLSDGEEELLKQIKNEQ